MRKIDTVISQIDTIDVKIDTRLELKKLFTRVQRQSTPSILRHACLA